MSSKRALRRRQCTGKQRFDSEADAIRAIRSLVRTQGHSGHISPYRCRFCGGFHFGHTPGQRRWQ